MKSPLSFILVITYSILPVILNGQQIPNRSFETWQSKTYYEKPAFWYTLNQLFEVTQTPKQVKKTNDAYHGNFALHLQSETIGNSVVAGAIHLFNPFYTNIFDGGVAFHGRPDSLVGFAKYHIKKNDTANFALLFKLNGNILGNIRISFIDSSDQYQRFSFPVHWLSPVDTPDVFSASITISQENVGGNFLKLDNLSFKGLKNDSFPNGDFEKWRTVKSDEVEGWSSSNILTLFNDTRSLTRTPDAYQGSYAAKIENTVTYRQDTVGYLTLGGLSENLLSNGLALNGNQPDSITGYYKYFPQNNDTALLGYNLTYFDKQNKSTIVLKERIINLPATPTYKRFSIALNYDSSLVADTLNLAFSAGNLLNGRGPQLGSRLYIDNLELHYSESTSTSYPNKKEHFKIYPNPVKTTLKIQYHATEAITFKIFNLNGQMINKINLRPEKQFTSINVESLKPGSYFYSAGEHTGKFIVAH